MDLLIEVIGIVMPVLLLIVIGFVLNKIGLISDQFVDVANPVIFRVFMPLNVFNNIYNVESFGDIRYQVLVIVFVIITIIILATGFMLSRTPFDNEEKAVTINGLIRSNIIIFGLALAQNYFDPKNMAIVTLYIVLITVIRDIYSIFVYEYYTQKGEGLDIVEFAKSVTKSPLFVSAVIGLIFAIFKIGVPQMIAKPIGQMASVTTPLGLMTVGAALQFDDKGIKDGILKVALILKGLVIPIAALGLGVLFGFRGAELFVLMILFATPIAVSSFNMAKEYTTKGDLAAKLVVYSTITNGFTVLFSLYILSFFDLL